ncbi:MAG: insulinase family protein [Ignavibacteria bacterium]|nr:insulinase family protein [Ignavibacteria bacterium]
MRTIGYTSLVLRNGLRVALHRNTAAPVVCINIAYNVGSKDEAQGKTGFAHLFEHLMFDGSANIPRGVFDRHCELAGGYNNAYTNEDKTNYYIVLPSNQLELGLWLESDRLLQLLLTPEGLETQRSVVMEEKRQRVDNQPYGTYDTKLSELLFPGHPYGHPVIGSMDDIASASMEDVTAFHSAFYRPDNAALVIAGDIDVDATAALVERWFGQIPAGGPPSRPVAPALAPLGEVREVVRDVVPLPGVFIGYRVPPERERAFIAMDLLSDILGNGESSRLHRALVYDQQIASQASVYVDPRQHPGILVVYALANQGRSAEELEHSIDTEIAKLLETPLPAAELEKTRNRVEGFYFQNLLSLSSRADRLAHHTLFDNDPDLVNTLLSQYLDVGVAELRDTAEAWLRPGHRVVLHYLPDGNAPVGDDEAEE